MEEVVATFQVARPAALDLARRSKEEEGDEQDGRAHRPSKRRRVESKAEPEGDGVRRNTRSRTKRLLSPSSQGAVEIMDTDEESSVQQLDEPDDGLVSCPLCGKRMKEATVFGHLDRCDGEYTDKAPRKR